jgi:hypothetical protein
MLYLADLTGKLTYLDCVSHYFRPSLYTAHMQRHRHGCFCPTQLIKHHKPRTESDLGRCWCSAEWRNGAFRRGGAAAGGNGGNGESRTAAADPLLQSMQPKPLAMLGLTSGSRDGDDMIRGEGNRGHLCLDVITAKLPVLSPR